MSQSLDPKTHSDRKKTTEQSQGLEGRLGALNSGSPPPTDPSRHTVQTNSLFATSPPELSLRSRAKPSSSAVRIASHRGSEDERAPFSTEEGEKGGVFTEPPVSGDDNIPHEPLEDSAEEQLSEEQLRTLFEDEEIERFLRHFNAHVQEVRLPVTNTPTVLLATGSQKLTTISDDSKGEVISPSTENSPVSLVKPEPDPDESEGIEDSAVWSIVDQSYLRPAKGKVADESQSPLVPSDSLYLSEKIARKYLLPNLPPLQPNPDHRFTIGRARLQAERFNLVTQPAYGPFFARMWGYASWKDRRTSLWYCANFWVLWFFDLLLPALFAVILYTLFRRRIFSYPTLEELRDRRHEAARAEALGEEVEKKFATGPNFGLRDAWSLFRSITKGKKKRKSRKGKSGNSEDAGAEEGEDVAKVQVHTTEGEGTVVKIDVQGESQVEKDIKRTILQALTEISDLHERVKNIFLWRRPQSSRKYAIVFALLFLVTLILPVQYLVKLTYFIGGFFFWFVPPVILGLPPDDRARFPPAFADSPTDAEYAMEMIALRVARGESVVPTKPKSAKQKKATKFSAGDAGSLPQDQAAEKEAKDKEVDWRKWGERAARGIAWAEGGKRLFKGDMPSEQGTWPQTNPSAAREQPNEEMVTSTYPAQHTSGPGLLTLTSTTVSFTQVFSSKPKVQIRLDRIGGVKKTGKIGGLTLKCRGSGDVEREENFRWVGGRDEVFAKIVGWGGRRWLQV